MGGGFAAFGAILSAASSLASGLMASESEMPAAVQAKQAPPTAAGVADTVKPAEDTVLTDKVNRGRNLLTVDSTGLSEVSSGSGLNL